MSCQQKKWPLRMAVHMHVSVPAPLRAHPCGSYYSPGQERTNWYYHEQAGTEYSVIFHEILNLELEIPKQKFVGSRGLTVSCPEP